MDGRLLVPVGLLAALVGLACGSAKPRAPEAPQATSLKMIWGPNTLPSGASAFPVYRELGVDVLQRQLPWAAVAARRPDRPRDPADPAYRWPAELGSAVRAARANGIRIALLVKQTPRWATSGRGTDWAPDRDSDYADFLYAASKRYPSVRHWMVWGEPTRPGNFRPMPPNRPAGPRRYAKLLDAGYEALKAAAKSNVVIGGMTWTVGSVTPPDFVRWMRLPSGKPPRLDYFGHNPFSTRFPGIERDPYYKGVRDINDADTLAAEVRRAYRSTGRRPRLWLSEFTIASDRPSRAFNFAVSREEQARWVAAAYALARRNSSYIAGLGWYALLDTESGSMSLTNGLLTATGRRKPAFDAYRNAR